MDARRQKAFDFAQSLTAQLITLSTGVIAITFTFAKDFVGGASGAVKVLLALSWLFFFGSILSGLLTLMGLTGSLEEKEPTPGDPSIRGRNVTAPAVFQSILFLIAVLLTVIAGAIAL